MFKNPPTKIVFNIKAAQPRVERAQSRETTWIAEILPHHLRSHNRLQVWNKECHGGGDAFLSFSTFLQFSIFYVLLALVGSELLEDYSIMRQCAIGGEQIRQNICRNTLVVDQ